MNLAPDQLALVLEAVRCVPEARGDDAWKYAADRLRPVAEPSTRKVRDVGQEIVERYGGRD